MYKGGTRSTFAVFSAYRIACMHFACVFGSVIQTLARYVFVMSYRLLSYDEVDKKFCLHDSALKVLKKLPAPVKVLAAVGDARIGKSTFLNMAYLHWDPSYPLRGNLPFGVGSTTQPCTRGVWIYVRCLPKGGSLVFVDVEGTQLGDDAVTEQLSAFTAVMSSLIILFVREVVNNAALIFLYHTTKLGKMFPDSERFPLLQVAIRDPLGLSPHFPSRQEEVVHSLTAPNHHDPNDNVRSEIASVFAPTRISACEVAFQERNQLENLQRLQCGPYFDSVLCTLANIKKIIPPKLTPQGMEMSGEDLVEMLQSLFRALENGDIAVLESAYERLEEQMCRNKYKMLIEPLLSMSEDEFLSNEQQYLKDFEKQCKVKRYLHRVQGEIETKKSNILQKKAAEKESKRAKEERIKAQEDQRKAVQAQRIAERKCQDAEDEQKEVEKKRQKLQKEKRNLRRRRSRRLSIGLGPLKFSVKL